MAFIGIGSLSVLVGIFAACTMTEPPRESSGAHAKDIKIWFHFGRESRMMKTIFREGWCKSRRERGSGMSPEMMVQYTRGQDFVNPNPSKSPFGKDVGIEPRSRGTYIYIYI